VHWRQEGEVRGAVALCTTIPLLAAVEPRGTGGGGAAQTRDGAAFATIM